MNTTTTEILTALANTTSKHDAPEFVSELWIEVEVEDGSEAEAAANRFAFEWFEAQHEGRTVTERDGVTYISGLPNGGAL
jgi:hypothetical protein